MTKYPQVVRAVSEAPWAIQPEKLLAILDLVAMRADGHRLSSEEIEARIGAAPAKRQVTTMGAVAVLPLAGVLVPKAGLMTQFSGGTSVQQFGRDIAQLAADPQIDAILIDIDSPGGMTDLIPEVAAQIREARGQKPIVAIANTNAASGAYWIAAQADEFVVTPSGWVGSIGVFSAHEDVSVQQEMKGVKTTLVSAGRYKVEKSPFEPLSDEARAAIQGSVDAFYDIFVRDVAIGRGVSEADVREGFGQGRIMVARDALAAGMVDRIDTFDATLERLARGAAARAANAGALGPPGGAVALKDSPQAATSGLSFAHEAEALRDSAARLVARTSSLAEVERGHLTVAKRERLSACTGELREVVLALDGLLAATAPDNTAAEVLRQRAQYERQRAHL